MTLDSELEIAQEALEEYATYLRFTQSLKKLAAQTLAQSITYGDGALWTSSLLIAGLTSSNSDLRTLFDRFPGYRSSLLSKIDFQHSLSTRQFNVRAGFPTWLTEALQYHRNTKRSSIDEESLLLIEIDHAIDTYSDAYSTFSQFAADLSRPIFEYGTQKEGQGAELIRMSYMLEDCFLLSMMCRQHPFRAFTRQDSSPTVIVPQSFRDIARDFTDPTAFKAARRIFYWHLRDAANVSVRLLTNDALEVFASEFDQRQFEEYCNENETDLEDAEFESRHAARQCEEQFLDAAALIYLSQIPISFLASRLSTWRKFGGADHWPLSAQLCLSVGEVSIEASMFDVGAPITVQHDWKHQQKLLAEVGIWAPSSIWTPRVLERFAYEINKKDTPEETLQHFFEAYPEFILDDLHTLVYPQIMLFQKHGKTLFPDFAIQRTGSEFVDLVEIKRPTARVFVIENGRPRLTAEANKAIAQLREYRDWFRTPSNRDWLRRQYGIDGFEPKMTLIIGRKVPSINDELMTKAMSGTEARVITYDDIEMAAKRRRLILP